MDYKIIDRHSFQVVGKTVRLSTKGGGHHAQIAQYWDQCYADGTIEKIQAINPGQNLLGVCMDFDEESEQLTYMIGAESASESACPGFNTWEIPASCWAVFTSVGPIPQAMADLWSRVFQEWFPRTGYQPGDAPQMEVYPPGDPSASDYRCEVWTPVEKKDK